MDDPEILDSIERIVVAGVAMTNASLGRSRPNLELTLQQWRVMVVLGDSADGRPVGEISRLIAVTRPATGRQLRRLEQRGLITLETDAHDRRVTRARLTGAGISARASILADRRASIESALHDQVVDDNVAAQLDRVASALESAGRSPCRPRGELIPTSLVGIGQSR
ncbi:MAG: MarR family transcriptional regulator [Thermomicrobiales bacterium]|nr:MAG: MarR family transcriptional regulator [Thermomicrobiales bacterium]